MKTTETLNPLLDTGLKIIQRPDMFNFTLDSKLLAGFFDPLKSTKKLIELGCGNGAVLLMVSQKTSAHLYGVELQEEAVNLANKNMAINHLEDKTTIIHDDINNIKKHFNHSSFDVVLSNPPFFKVHPNSLKNDSDFKTKARHETTITLDAILENAAYLLNQKGKLIMVHRAQRLCEILTKMSKYKLYPKRMRFVHTKAHKDAAMVLIEAMYQSPATLSVEAPLFIHDQTGEYTEAYMTMLNRK